MLAWKRKREQNLTSSTEVTVKIGNKIVFASVEGFSCFASFSLPQHIRGECRIGRSMGVLPLPISGTSKTIAFLTKTQSRFVSVVSRDVLRL